MEHFSIRLSDINDNQDIAEIAVCGWQQTYKGIVSADHLAAMQTEPIVSNRIKFCQDPKKAGYVAVVNNRLVGFCDFGPVRFIESENNIDSTYCEIYAMYILEPYQKQGIGSALFKNASQHLKQLGFENLVIWSLMENTKAANFYRSLGGVERSLHKTINIAGDEHQCLGFYYNLSLIGE